MNSITLHNIDLENVTIKEQAEKFEEEQMELVEALSEGTDAEVIEELLDVFQSLLGCVYKIRRISADQIMSEYYKHEDKLKNRPRD